MYITTSYAPEFGRRAVRITWFSSMHLDGKISNLSNASSDLSNCTRIARPTMKLLKDVEIARKSANFI